MRSTHNTQNNIALNPIYDTTFCIETENLYRLKVTQGQINWFEFVSFSIKILVSFSEKKKKKKTSVKNRSAFCCCNITRHKKNVCYRIWCGARALLVFNLQISYCNMYWMCQIFFDETVPQVGRTKPHSHVKPYEVKSIRQMFTSKFIPSKSHQKSIEILYCE